MATKKPKRKSNFLKRLHNTPKMKRIKKRLDKINREKKKLGAEYRRTVKSESKRLTR